MKNHKPTSCLANIATVGEMDQMEIQLKVRLTSYNYKIPSNYTNLFGTDVKQNQAILTTSKLKSKVWYLNLPTNRLLMDFLSILSFSLKVTKAMVNLN